jgi:DNA-binding response OmpR family regulator
MRLLVVEEETLQTQLLLSKLRRSYAVDFTNSFDTAEVKIDGNDYDACIFGHFLADGNGISVTQKLRLRQHQMPILLLSHLRNGHMVEVALDAGIDDYVAKPYNTTELLARVRALIRRSPTRVFSSTLQKGDLELHTHTGRVCRQGQPITLRTKEFMLLEYLMRYDGQIVSRAQLFEHVWNEAANPFSNTIDAHINTLRKKVDFPFATRLIKTVPGRGYKLEVEE